MEEILIFTSARTLFARSLDQSGALDLSVTLSSSSPSGPLAWSSGTGMILAVYNDSAVRSIDLMKEPFVSSDLLCHAAPTPSSVPVTALVLRKKGSDVMLARSNKLIFWELKSNTCRTIKSPSGTFTALALNHNGSLLGVCLSTGLIIVYSTLNERNSTLRQPQPSTAPLIDLKFHPHRNNVLCVLNSRCLLMYDVSKPNGVPLSVLSLSIHNPSFMAVSPNTGSIIVTATKSGHLCVLDIDHQKLLGSKHVNLKVSALAFSSDSLLIGNTTGEVVSIKTEALARDVSNATYIHLFSDPARNYIQSLLIMKRHAPASARSAQESASNDSTSESSAKPVQLRSRRTVLEVSQRTKFRNDHNSSVAAKIFETVSKTAKDNLATAEGRLDASNEGDFDKTIRPISVVDSPKRKNGHSSSVTTASISSQMNTSVLLPDELGSDLSAPTYESPRSAVKSPQNQDKRPSNSETGSSASASRLRMLNPETVIFSPSLSDSFPDNTNSRPRTRLGLRQRMQMMSGDRNNSGANGITDSPVAAAMRRRLHQRQNNLDRKHVLVSPTPRSLVPSLNGNNNEASTASPAPSNTGAIAKSVQGAVLLASEPSKDKGKRPGVEILSTEYHLAPGSRRVAWNEELKHSHGDKRTRSLRDGGGTPRKALATSPPLAFSDLGTQSAPNAQSDASSFFSSPRAHVPLQLRDGVPDSLHVPNATLPRDRSPLAASKSRSISNSSPQKRSATPKSYRNAKRSESLRPTELRSTQPHSINGLEASLRDVVKDTIHDFQAETRNAIIGLHLDLVRAGREWKIELNRTMQHYEKDLQVLRQENARLRIENERMRKT